MNNLEVNKYSCLIVFRSRLSIWSHLSVSNLQ